MIDEKGKEVIPCMYDDVCYKSNYQTIDTQFDMAPTTVLKKTIIPYPVSYTHLTLPTTPYV